MLTKKYRFIEFFVPGIIAMSVMTSSLSGAVNMNAELRQKGVIRKLSTTPITRTDWILSNILYQFILAVISTMAILRGELRRVQRAAADQRAGSSRSSCSRSSRSAESG